MGGVGGEDVVEGEETGGFAIGGEVADGDLLFGGVELQEVGGGWVGAELLRRVSFSLRGRTRTNTRMHYSGIWKIK